MLKIKRREGERKGGHERMSERGRERQRVSCVDVEEVTLKKRVGFTSSWILPPVITHSISAVHHLGIRAPIAHVITRTNTHFLSYQQNKVPSTLLLLFVSSTPSTSKM